MWFLIIWISFSSPIKLNICSISILRVLNPFLLMVFEKNVIFSRWCHSAQECAETPQGVLKFTNKEITLWHVLQRHQKSIKVSVASEIPLIPHKYYHNTQCNEIEIDGLYIVFNFWGEHGGVKLLIVREYSKKTERQLTFSPCKI